MVAKLTSINVRELPKAVPQFLQNNWKTTAVVATCFFVVLPTLIFLYQRWTAQNPSVSLSVTSTPAPVGPSAPHGLSLLLPRPSLKGGVDAIKLGFAVDTLNRAVVIKNIMPDPDRPTRTYVFSSVCDDILKAICASNGKSPIIFNNVDSGHILDFLNFGLPEGESYHMTTPDNQKQSWVYQTLQALATGRYISSFEICNNNDRTEIRIIV
jgi:hypothetical protein